MLIGGVGVSEEGETGESTTELESVACTTEVLVAGVDPGMDPKPGLTEPSTFLQG